MYQDKRTCKTSEKQISSLYRTTKGINQKSHTALTSTTLNLPAALALTEDPVLEPVNTVTHSDSRRERTGAGKMSIKTTAQQTEKFNLNALPQPLITHKNGKKMVTKFKPKLSAVFILSIISQT